MENFLYQTEVIKIGKHAAEFLDQGIVILFGEIAPQELSDYSYIIKIREVLFEIRKGMFLQIDDSSYKILSVGEDVNKNLNVLGHITINYNGKDIAELPGTLYVENKEVPRIKENTTIKILRR